METRREFNNLRKKSTDSKIKDLHSIEVNDKVFKLPVMVGLQIDTRRSRTDKQTVSFPAVAGNG